MAKKINKHQKRVANDIMKAMKTARISYKEPLVFMVGDGICTIVPENTVPFMNEIGFCSEGLVEMFDSLSKEQQGEILTELSVRWAENENLDGGGLNE